MRGPASKYRTFRSPISSLYAQFNEGSAAAHSNEKRKDLPISQSAQHRRCDIAANPDIDRSRQVREYAPDYPVPKGADVGDDDVLQEEETSDSENVD